MQWIVIISCIAYWFYRNNIEFSLEIAMETLQWLGTRCHNIRIQLILWRSHSTLAGFWALKVRFKAQQRTLLEKEEIEKPTQAQDKTKTKVITEVWMRCTLLQMQNSSSLEVSSGRSKCGALILYNSKGSSTVITHKKVCTFLTR